MSRALTVLGQYLEGAKQPKHRDSSVRTASAHARALLRACYLLNKHAAVRAYLCMLARKLPDLILSVYIDLKG